VPRLCVVAVRHLLPHQEVDACIAEQRSAAEAIADPIRVFMHEGRGLHSVPPDQGIEGHVLAVAHHLSPRLPYLSARKQLGKQSQKGQNKVQEQGSDSKFPQVVPHPFGKGTQKLG